MKSTEDFSMTFKSRCDRIMGIVDGSKSLKALWATITSNGFMRHGGLIHIRGMGIMREE